mgnify:CR=1 FL=1
MVEQLLSILKKNRLLRFLEKIRIIQRIDQLIKMKATGSVRQLASRVGVSRSTLYEILNVMKAMGAEIEYSNAKNTYYYNSEKVLAIGFVNKSIISGEKIYKSPGFSDRELLP